MKTIQTHTAQGNQFFYIETEHGFMCSFSKSFDDVWFQEELDSSEPIEGPECVVIEELIKEIR